MMTELFQSQRRKVEAASLSHSIMLWGSLKTVCAQFSSSMFCLKSKSKWEIMGFTLLVVATDVSRRNLVQWPQWKLSLSISTLLDYLRWQSISEPSQIVIFSLSSEAPRGYYLHAYYHSTHYNGMYPTCVHVSLCNEGKSLSQGCLPYSTSSAPDTRLGT